jgi:hypothetical protein
MTSNYAYIVSISSDESISILVGGTFAYYAQCFITAPYVAFSASDYDFFNGETTATNFSLTYTGTGNFDFPTNPQGVSASDFFEIITTSEDPVEVSLDGVSTSATILLQGPSIVVAPNFPTSTLIVTTASLTFDTSYYSQTYSQIIVYIYGNASIYEVSNGIFNTPLN